MTKKNITRISGPISRITCLLFFAFFFHGSKLLAQEKPTASQQDSIDQTKQIDIFDVIRKWRGKPFKPVITIPQPYVKNISLLPIVGYSPANGFVLGAAISSTSYLGDPKKTRLSSALINASFTTKAQILLNLRFDLFLKENKWYMSGDNRLLFFSQPTYGLGIYGLQGQPYTFNISGSSVTKIVTDQPMRFNYIRLYDNFMRRISGQWYAGIGPMFDIDFNIKDEYLQDSGTSAHYRYSRIYGFDTLHYSANGFAFSLMQDTRDNPVNAYKGSYIYVAYRFNAVALGSSKASDMFYYDLRKYIGVKSSVPRDVLAFWLWGTFQASGTLPYLTLPAITWDTYNRSGRGYIQGRFRGTNMMYGEMEYRFRLSQNGLFGGVVFLNGTTASNPLTDQKVLNAIAPGYGFGLRIMMNKNDRTNICVDYGMGDGFAGIYFNIRETF